jgi:acyl-homoserine lactone acylase PvdQ
MSGAIPEEELQGRLKELGSRVKDMGMAGVALAKDLNMGYKELVKMGDVAIDPLEGQEKTAETTEQALKRMQEEQLGVSKKLEQTVNILSDKMSQAFDKAMPALNKIGSWMRGFAQKIKLGALVFYAFLAFGGVNLFKKLWNSFTDGSKRASVDTSKNLTRGFQGSINNMTNSVSSALSMGYKKGVDKIAAQKEIKMRVREEIRAERRESGADFAKRAQAAEFIQECRCLKANFQEQH